MELASSGEWRIRQANQSDAGEIGRLLQRGALRHIHADWHLPADWLGEPGFVVCEAVSAGGRARLLGCLAVGADPPPAAWVRVAAVAASEDGEACLSAMLRRTLPWLGDGGVSVLGWLPEELWPPSWLSGLGFGKVNWIITYSLETLATEVGGNGAVSIRPAKQSDLPQLAALEASAFEPLWRHSAWGLSLAFRQALSFEMAELDGRVVGFQYSVAGRDGLSAHLVRLTVSPEAQGQGVGSRLMAAALQGYVRAGFERATLNTQLDNHASHHLYERFGFRRIGNRTPVWAMALTEGDGR